jgi:predicted  nucleic acid-binding Zn-ribbon protein
MTILSVEEIEVPGCKCGTCGTLSVLGGVEMGEKCRYCGGTYIPRSEEEMKNHRNAVLRAMAEPVPPKN